MIAIFKEDNMYVPRQFGNGQFWVLPSIIEDVIDDLIYYCYLYDDETIKQINSEIDKHLFDEFNSYKNKPETTKINKKDGYVYVLECGGKYKIGFSKDVERRMQQLDTRPFPIKLVFKIYSDVAFDVEQKTHDRLQAYKITGEWYENISIDAIKQVIEENMRYLK